jgi:nucleotide sugar dehydrogenase
LSNVRNSTNLQALSGRRVGVIGLGYVGIATALSFADHGAEIIGLDISESRLSAIEEFRIDLLDRDKLRLEHALSSGLLHMTTDPKGLSEAELIVVCVPTPVDNHLTPDLAALASACNTVVANASAGQVFVLTSTTYPGCTGDLLVKPLQVRGFKVGDDVFVAFSPERIDPGNSVHTPDSTPRIIGGQTAECAGKAAEFLKYTSSEIHLVSTPESAELTKLLENTFRAVNIAMINEFADAARHLNVDIMEVVEAASTKPYGFMTFTPGPGVGGHCIPCDPHYLLWQLRARRVESPVVDAAMKAIAARPGLVAARARQILGEVGVPLGVSRVLVVGVSYKAGLGDVRESPALEIIELLAAGGAEVSYSDPFVQAIRVPTAGTLSSNSAPHEEYWDLIILHTLHPNVDQSWLEGHRAVLDATYKSGLPGAFHV